jgi:hypothetical protein
MCIFCHKGNPINIELPMGVSFFLLALLEQNYQFVLPLSVEFAFLHLDSFDKSYIQ